MDYTRGTQEIKKYLSSKLKKFNVLLNDEKFAVEIIEGVSSPIYISKVSDSLSIKKSVSFNHKDDFDIQMFFRVKKSGDFINLWPTKFISKDGRSINAEIEMNGKLMINQKVQNELIELANTWGKALLAQEVKHKLQPSL